MPVTIYLCENLSAAFSWHGAKPSLYCGVRVALGTDILLSRLSQQDGVLTSQGLSVNFECLDLELHSRSSSLS